MEKALENPNVRVFLSNEFASRVQRNPAYSLRSFSRSLGVSPASLSQILTGKRPLTRKTALKIADRLFLSPVEKRSFLVTAFGLETPTDEAFVSKTELQELEIDKFRLISDWHHYAILGLAGLEKNQANPEWISKQLRISRKEAREAFQRLVRLGLIQRVGTRIRRTSPFFKVATRPHENAIRKYHSQNLRKASDVLEDPKSAVELFSGITMAVNEQKLPEARDLIRQFRRKLSELVETGNKTRVYTLSVQLFPISEGDSK